MRAGLTAYALPLLGLVMLAGCREPEMSNQPKHKPMTASEMFSDKLSARPLVEGTVPRGGLRTDEALYAGQVGGQPVSEFPFALTALDLRRGREQFDIFCAVCHGRLGDGTGMIVQRGFTPPSSFHVPRLREAPAGHFYDVITNGFGAMFSYRERISPQDRWRIVAHIRALQLSEQQAPTLGPQLDRGGPTTRALEPRVSP